MSDIRKKVQVLFIALTLMITNVGCANKDYDENDVSYGYDDSSNNRFIDYCEEINPEYNYDEYYITEDNVDEIVELVLNNDVFCNNESLDKDMLFNSIVNNTYLYVDSKDDVINVFDMGNNEYGLDQEMLNNYIFDAIWNSISLDSSNMSENYCKMSEINIVINNDIDSSAIFIGPISSDNKSFDVIDSNTIMLNMDSIYNEYYSRSNNDSSYDDPGTIYEFISYVLSHELSHVKQDICSCRIDDGQLPYSIDIFYNSENGVDCIGKTLIEASAESSLYGSDVSSNHNDFFVYDLYREDEAMLMLLGIFNHDSSDYYNAVMNTDFKKFYNFYNLDSNSEAYTFYKILYDFDASHNENNFLKNIGEEDLSYYEVRELLGNAAYIDLYKLYVGNLIDFCSNNDVSFSDSIFLNQFFKTVVFNKLDDCNLDISNEFVVLDEIFKCFVSEHYDISFEDIKAEEGVQLNNIIGLYCEDDDVCFDIYSRYPIVENVIFVLDGDFMVSKDFNNSHSEIRDEVKSYIKK